MIIPKERLTKTLIGSNVKVDNLHSKFFYEDLQKFLIIGFQL